MVVNFQIFGDFPDMLLVSSLILLQLEGNLWIVPCFKFVEVYFMAPIMELSWWMYHMYLKRVCIKLVEGIVI